MCSASRSHYSFFLFLCFDSTRLGSIEWEMDSVYNMNLFRFTSRYKKKPECTERNSIKKLLSQFKILGKNPQFFLFINIDWFPVYLLRWWILWKNQQKYQRNWIRVQCTVFAHFIHSQRAVEIFIGFLGWEKSSHIYTMSPSPSLSLSWDIPTRNSLT